MSRPIRARRRAALGEVLQAAEDNVALLGVGASVRRRCVRHWSWFLPGRVRVG